VQTMATDAVAVMKESVKSLVRIRTRLRKIKDALVQTKDRFTSSNGRQNFTRNASY